MWDYGKIKPEEIPDIINNGDRSKARKNTSSTCTIFGGSEILMKYKVTIQYLLKLSFLYFFLTNLKCSKE